MSDDDRRVERLTDQELRYALTHAEEAMERVRKMNGWLTNSGLEFDYSDYGFDYNATSARSYLDDVLTELRSEASDRGIEV